MKQSITLLFLAFGFLVGISAHAQTNLTGTGYLNIGPQIPGGTAAGDATVGGVLRVPSIIGTNNNKLSITGWALFNDLITIRSTSNPGLDWTPENIGGTLAFGYNYSGGQRIKFVPRGNWPYSLDVAIPGSTTIGGTLYVGTPVNASSLPVTAMNSLKLAVDGPIGARSAIYIRAPGAARPDYVFAPTYKLRSLPETACYIQANGHLPDVPSAADVAHNGIELAALNATLLRKVEEITLHLIALQSETTALKLRVEQLSTTASPGGCR